MKLKIGFIAAAVVIIAALGYGLYSNYTRVRALEKENAALTAKLKAQTAATVAQVNTGSTVKVVVKPRPGSSVKPKPGQSQSPASVPNCELLRAGCVVDYHAEKKGSWSYSDPDALDDQPGQLTFPPGGLIDQVVAPYEQRVSDLERALSKASRVPVVVVDWQARAGYQTNQQLQAGAEVSARFGAGKFRVGPYAGAGVQTMPDGTVAAYGVAGAVISGTLWAK